MSRNYAFNRNLRAVTRLLEALEKRTNDKVRYHEIAHELVKMGLVTQVNGTYKPVENVKNTQLSLVVDRLNARFSPATSCAFCAISQSQDFASCVRPNTSKVGEAQDKHERAKCCGIVETGRSLARFC